MKSLFQSVPIPMSGVMLAFMSLANLLYARGFITFAHGSFFIGILLYLLLVGKLVFAPASVIAEMKNPIIASVSPTFTMGTLVASCVLQHYAVSDVIIHAIWIFAATLQIFIIGYFIKTFIWKQHITIAHVFPSWLILFVGTAVMPLTAGDLSGPFTQGIVIFASCAFTVLVPMIIWRGFIRHDLPEPTMPMLAILTAPASLTLAAYFEQFAQKTFIIVILYSIAQCLFVLVLTKLPALLKLPFYPSYAALTFPLVITATTTNALLQHLVFSKVLTQLVTVYFYMQLTLAIGIVLYVLVRYVNYLSIQVRTKRA